MKLLKVSACCALCVLFVSASLAAEQVDEIGKKIGVGGRYFMNGDPFKLIQTEEVQKELGLTDDQKSAVKKLVKECTADEAKTIVKRTSSMEEEQKNYLEWDDRTQKKVNNLLKPEQRTRMQEISIQTTGPRSLIRKDVIEKLGLNEEQQKKLLDAVFHPSAKKTPSEARVELEANTTASLTDKQKTEFDKLKGKKIGFDPDKLKLR